VIEKTKAKRAYFQAGERVWTDPFITTDQIQEGKGDPLSHRTKRVRSPSESSHFRSSLCRWSRRRQE